MSQHYDFDNTSGFIYNVNMYRITINNKVWESGAC